MADDLDYDQDDGLFDRVEWDLDIDRLLEQSREEQVAWLGQVTASLSCFWWFGHSVSWQTLQAAIHASHIWLPQPLCWQTPDGGATCPQSSGRAWS